MLRRGNSGISTRGVNRNNWILDYQPDPGVAVGGRGGTLRATLAVNRVTQTGDRNQVGRVVIGQIHAENDEPIRLYYRKYPENERGFVYFAHEIRNSDDIYFPVLGPVSPKHGRDLGAAHLWWWGETRLVHGCTTPRQRAEKGALDQLA